MVNYINKNYSENSTVFLNMLLLNIRNKEFYSSLVDLNIVHLFVVSGMHIAIICTIIEKLIKNKYINTTINFAFSILTFYITGFSISVLRVIITMIIKKIKKLKEISNIERVCIVGFILIIINPFSCLNFSYILSILTTLIVAIIIDSTKNKIMIYLLVNIFLSLIILPITISFNKEFNPLYFVNNILFSNLIIIFYCFELICCWIPFMFNINNIMLTGIHHYLTTLSQLQLLIKMNINKNVILIFYICFFLIANFYIKQNVIKEYNIKCLI